MQNIEGNFFLVAEISSLGNSKITLKFLEFFCIPFFIIIINCI